MQDFQISTTVYKLRLRDDNTEHGLLNWAPLRQLNAWANSRDTYTLRASIMAFGWRQFLLSGPRAHHFHSLDEARSALAQLVEEASLLKLYSVSPHMSLPDLFMMNAKQAIPIDAAVEDEVYGKVEIADVLISQHDLIVASIQDAKTSAAWYVGYHNREDGHLFLGNDASNVSWLPEDDLKQAWSSPNEIEALDMAKRITRTQDYYAYPIRLQNEL
ncbi:hypothetical protein RYA05_05440 [Pseudomonas syringae pv. actinidiae]|nr:hypothetical protein [Pseudomonas syringae pv. actinidiae]